MATCKTSTRYTALVAKNLVENRLHRARPGYRCRCAQCRHLIRMAALRAGIPESRLLAALPPVREEEKRERSARSRALAAPVSTTVTVTRDGERRQGTEALKSLMTAR